MKKLAIYLIALSAISTAALAEGNHESCDSNNCVNEHSVQLKRATTNAHARAVVGETGASTDSERLTIPGENHQGSRD